MELTERVSTIETSALSLGAPSAARVEPRTAQQRLASLDVMRGFTVLGMIVVNTLASSRGWYGFNPDSSFLDHSRWAGFTFADFVFPAFIVMCGFSVAVSLRHRGMEWPVFRRIATRSLALLVLGFLLANITWFGDTAHGTWRLMGVLQRIGLCYFATAILFVTCGPRACLFIALAVLVLYWPLALVPFPDHATDLLAPGANFISSVDRWALGPHAFFAGTNGFDPEGLLSTLPAIAQCLLGAVAGVWLLDNRTARSAPLKLAIGGAAILAFGLLWSPYFPLVKNIWTSSFVLVSTGLVLLLLALSFWALDQQRFSVRGAVFLQAFGMNALLAYVVQESLQLLPAGGEMQAIGAASQKTELSVAVANLPIVIFIIMLWLPLEFMRRRRWIVKI